jgi:hypothetical protein
MLILVLFQLFTYKIINVHRKIGKGLPPRSQLSVLRLEVEVVRKHLGGGVLLGQVDDDPVLGVLESILRISFGRNLRTKLNQSFKKCINCMYCLYYHIIRYFCPKKLLEVKLTDNKITT